MDERQGVTARTAGKSENGFTFNDVLGMLFLDIIVFSLMAWYAGNVRRRKNRHFVDMLVVFV